MAGLQRCVEVRFFMSVDLGRCCMHFVSILLRTPLKKFEEAQLSQRDRATHYVS